ncbi:MAG: hypothetical protein Q8R55_00640 [Candidatus Taylorbacteria bacterium]|nr:hypothetical protein [Candidatus Taylorbacteria bacterium]
MRDWEKGFSVGRNHSTGEVHYIMWYEGQKPTLSQINNTIKEYFSDTLPENLRLVAETRNDGRSIGTVLMLEKI